MKIVFFSNYLNHHQLPFCLAMDKLTGGKFIFVATTPTPVFRKHLGYQDLNKEYPFVLTTYDNKENMGIAMALASKCDVAITGAAPEIFTKVRMQKNLVTFRCAERICKGGIWKSLSLRRYAGMWKYHTRYIHKPLYMLCASAYAAVDFGLAFAYLGKKYKWGYFPELIEYDLENLFAEKRKNKKITILWAGRLIDWKHPETMVLLAERLQNDGFEFVIDIIGSGPMEIQIQEMIRDKRLDEIIHIRGSMTPQNVRVHMEKADIFLFTSDSNEGWGAVLNEAMNSGCAVIANRSSGAAPYLVVDGENGYLYQDGNFDQMYKAVIRLIEERRIRENMGKEAYRTMVNQWNAKVAAERFLSLANALKDGETPPRYVNGPCSKAKIFITKDIMR